MMEFFAVQIANIGVFGNRLGALFPVVCSSIHRTTLGGGKGEVLAVAGADNIAAFIGSENRYVGVTQTRKNGFGGMSVIIILPHRDHTVLGCYLA